MRKIRFKTEYVPLSDDAISRHKDFDQLMSMYVAAPKINWFKRFLKNKWTMFGGGLMTGAIITSLFWFNHTTEINQPANTSLSQTEKIKTEEIQTQKIQAEETRKEDQVSAIPDKTVAAQPAAVNNSTEEKATEVSSSSTVAAATHLGEPTEKSGKSADESSAEKQNESFTATAVSALKEKSSQAVKGEIAETPGYTTASKNDESIEPLASFQVETIAPILPAAYELPLMATLPENELITGKLVEHSNEAYIAASPFPKNKKSKNGGVVAGTATAAGVENSTTKKEIAPNDKSAAEEKTEPKDSSSALSFLNLKWLAFKHDTTSQDSAVTKEVKKGWFAFLKDSSDHSTSSTDSLYVPRYAQVSFVTPISSNGIDGYKYMHYISLNVLQGYSGALRGAEFGGLLNGDKGYVTGAQFAGLGNFAGGDLKGAQFGGLANISKSVQGAQFAGITNLSKSFVTGFQAAGIANISPDSMNGVQVAGIVNIISSEKESQGLQIAGIGNVSVATVRGTQIGGVFNLAKTVSGGQIGTINIGKNIKGFQIGVINISDSIDGVPIGLITISKTGVFDVNVWSGDILTLNAGLRVGSKYVYNIYSYGVSPFKDELPFGFGIGIGGHIPINRAFIDIDGMVWSMHRSYMSFHGVNLINQFRVMGGFTINKYLSVFAGPVLNVGVQDNSYEPFNNYSWYEHSDGSTTVNIWPGFVAGVRIF
jgi:hypothetical protein